VLLADDLVEPRGTQARRERRLALEAFGRGRGEQVI
jgi:hypothetical protein